MFSINASMNNNKKPYTLTTINDKMILPFTSKEGENLEYSNSKHIQQVVEGFSKFYGHVIESNKFDSTELRNFMEVQFKKAGYRQSSKIRKETEILIIHDGAIGDFITMSAAIRETRRIYPDAHIVLSINQRVISLAECCPYVDEIIISNLKCRTDDLYSSYFACLEFAKDHLLKYRFDIAYASIFGMRPFNPLLAYMSGAKECISHATAYTRLFFPLMTLLAPFPLYGTHCADIAMSYLDYQLRAPVSNRQLEIWVDSSDIDKLKQLLPQSDNLYGVCLGGSLPRKHWSPKFYSELLNMILNIEQAKFVILGGSQDFESGQMVESLVGSEYITNLAGKLSIRESAAALSFCKTYIGNDTGMMHAASAVGIPILAPFCFPQDIKLPSNLDIISSLKRWYPYGVPSIIVQPKHALPECKDSKDDSGCKIENKEAHCINQITPKTMFRAFQLLKKQISKNVIETVFFS